MKPINSATILDQLLEWVYYFKQDKGRLPLSLEDLTKNSTKEEDDGDLEPVLTYFREKGYNILYKISEQKKGCFELSVQYKQDQPSRYEGNGEQQE